MNDFFKELDYRNKKQIEMMKVSSREDIAEKNRISKESSETIRNKTTQTEKEQDRALALHIHNSRKQQLETEERARYQGKKYDVDSNERIENKRQWVEQSESEKAHLREIEILNGKLNKELQSVKIQESYSLQRTNNEWKSREVIEKQKGRDLISVEQTKGQFLENIQKIKKEGDYALSREQTNRETAVSTLKANSEISIQKIITSGLSEVEKEKSYRAITLAYIQAENEIDKIETQGKEERKTYINKVSMDIVAHRKNTLMDMVSLTHSSNLEMDKMILASALKIIEWEEEKRIWGGKYGAEEKEVENIFNENYSKWKEELEE